MELELNRAYYKEGTNGTLFCSGNYLCHTIELPWNNNKRNDALKELQGCIAPVTYLSGIGKGIYSKNAMQKLLSLVYQAKDRKEQILLTIKSQNYEHCRTL